MLKSALIIAFYIFPLLNYIFPSTQVLNAETRLIPGIYLIICLYSSKFHVILELGKFLILTLNSDLETWPVPVRHYVY